MNVISSVLFLLLLFLWAPSRGQYFAQKAHNLIHEECPKYPARSEAESEHIKIAAGCANGNNAQARLRFIKKQNGVVSEDAYLASLAAERSRLLTCTKDHLEELQKSPENTEHFTSDFAAKLTLMGHERRKIMELKPKVAKDPSLQKEYDDAISRFSLLFESLPFKQLRPVQKVIEYTLSQYDKSTPDRLDSWLPGQTEKFLKEALPRAIESVKENKDVMDEGVSTMGASLKIWTRETLVQDTNLVEYFRQQNPDIQKEMIPIACHVDAKYGRGARYRDGALTAMSLLGPWAAMGLTRAGAVGAASSITGAAAAGSISIRSAGILRIMAGAAGTVAGLLQTHKACLGQNITIITGTQKPDNLDSCEKDVLKSLIVDNCLVAAGLNAFGFIATTQAVRNAYAQVKTGKVTLLNKPIPPKKLTESEIEAIPDLPADNLMGRRDRAIASYIRQKELAYEQAVAGAQTSQQKLKYWDKQVQTKDYELASRERKLADKQYLSLKNSKDGEIAGIDYKFLDAERQAIKIEDSWTAQSHRELGVHSYLTQQLIKQNPSVKSVSASLADVNKEALLKQVEQGLSLEEAFRNTPIFKSLAPQGFTNIESIKKVFDSGAGSHYYEFVLRRR